MRGHSGLIGSFTFMIMSASRQTASASAPIFAPTDVYAESGNPLPSPAPFSIMTLCPAPTSASAPAGTSATRFSLVLISFGTPIFIELEIAFDWLLNAATHLRRAQAADFGPSVTSVCSDGEK